MRVDAEAMREAIQQRDRMSGMVEQLKRELQRTRAKAEKDAASLSTEAQQMHTQLNEQRRKNHELSQLVKQQEAQLTHMTSVLQRQKRGAGTVAGLVGASKSQPRLTMPPVATAPPASAPSGGGGGGLQHSATVGELRPAAHMGDPPPPTLAAPTRRPRLDTRCRQSSRSRWSSTC